MNSRAGRLRSATAATTTATTTTTSAGFAEISVGTDVAHRGLQRIRLAGALLLATAAGLILILVRATKTRCDALGSLHEATVKGLLQRVGNARKLQIVVMLA